MIKPLFRFEELTKEAVIFARWLLCGTIASGGFRVRYPKSFESELTKTPRPQLWRVQSMTRLLARTYNRQIREANRVGLNSGMIGDLESSTAEIVSDT